MYFRTWTWAYSSNRYVSLPEGKWTKSQKGFHKRFVEKADFLLCQACEPMEISPTWNLQLLGVIRLIFSWMYCCCWVDLGDEIFRCFCWVRFSPHFGLCWMKVGQGCFFRSGMVLLSFSNCCKCLNCQGFDIEWFTLLICRPFLNRNPFHERDSY